MAPGRVCVAAWQGWKQSLFLWHVDVLAAKWAGRLGTPVGRAL